MTKSQLEAYYRAKCNIYIRPVFDDTISVGPGGASVLGTSRGKTVSAVRRRGRRSKQPPPFKI
jgi:hypothetical protein